MAKNKKAGVELTAPKGITSPRQISGCDDFNHCNLLVAQVANATHYNQLADPKERSKLTDSILVNLANINPADAIEGMLSAQLIATHHAVMDCYRRNMVAEQTFVGRDMNLKHAAKLTRSFAALLEALNRHRGKGSQLVRVEHVTVEAGAQAIVGHVTHTGGGGGATKVEEQPHAKHITHAPEQAMPCTDPQGEKVPVSSHA